MRKNILLTLLGFLTGTIAQAQLDNWQPSAVYVLDKPVITQLKKPIYDFRNNLSTGDFNVLKDKFVNAITANTPSFVKLDSLITDAGISFSGISSPANGLNSESVLASVQGYIYRQYLQTEFSKTNDLVLDFKNKMIESVNSAQLAIDIKKEVAQRIKSTSTDLFFDFEKAATNAIDNLGPALSTYLTGKLGNEWEGIKNRLNDEAERIMTIPNRLRDGINGYVDKNVKILGDISYFAGQITQAKAAYDAIKNSNPAEAFKLLQKSELYQKIIESSDLRQFNDYGVKALSVIQDADQLKQILASDDNPVKKALQSFPIIEKEIRAFFPQGSADLTKSLDALSNTEDLAKINLYASVGKLAVGLSSLSPEQKNQANLVINAGVAIASFYTGNIVGGVMASLSVLDGLFGGSKKQDDGMLKMMMDFQRSMVEHIDKQFENLNNNLSIISGQIHDVSKQITELRHDILDFTAKCFEALSNQMQQGFNELYKMQVEILKDIRDLRGDLYRLHEENMLMLNSLDNKVDLIYQQTGCIISEIQALALKDLLGCRRTCEDIAKAAPRTINAYDSIYSKNVQQCYDGIRDLLKPNQVTTPFIDYSFCGDSEHPGNPMNDPIVYYGTLKRRWIMDNNTPESFLSLLNPSNKVTEDQLIQRSIGRNDESMAAAFPGNAMEEYKKMLALFAEDKLNNPRFVIEIANWYLQTVPFVSVMDKNTGGKKTRSQQLQKIDDVFILNIIGDLEFLKTVLQLTIAQQSLMSGTTLLNGMYNVLKFGKLEERQEIVGWLEKNILLRINFAKFVCSSATADANGNFVIKNEKTVMGRLSDHPDQVGNFYIIVAKSDTINLLVKYYKGEKNGTKIETLMENGISSLVNDPKLLMNLADTEHSTERVLPPGFSTLIELHKKFTDMLTEIRALQSLSPNDLSKLKYVYLN